MKMMFSRLSQIIFILVLLFLLASCEETGMLLSSRSYSIGDRGPDGGIIFYVDTDDLYEWTYLEAARAGWHGDEDPKFIFGFYRPDPEGRDQYIGTSTALGSGKSNTEALVSKIWNTAYIDNTTKTTKDYAARICSDYYWIKDDYFLPSSEELNLMYKNLALKGLGGFSNDTYWSSSEYKVAFASSQNFFGGFPSSTSFRDNYYRVRPVRAF